jgi:hypothetical protein
MLGTTVADELFDKYLLWKHGFVRPRDLGTDAAEYRAEMYDRFDRFALAAVVVLVPRSPSSGAVSPLRASAPSTSSRSPRGSAARSGTSSWRFRAGKHGRPSL